MPPKRAKKGKKVVADTIKDSFAQKLGVDNGQDDETTMDNSAQDQETPRSQGFSIDDQTQEQIAKEEEDVRATDNDNQEEEKKQEEPVDVNTPVSEGK